jgi:hypothetical protein
VTTLLVGIIGGRRRGNREGSLQWRPKEKRWRGQLLLDARRKTFYGETRAEVLAGIDQAKKLHAMGLPVGVGKEPLSRFLERGLRYGEATEPSEDVSTLQAAGSVLASPAVGSSIGRIRIGNAYWRVRGGRTKAWCSRARSALRSMSGTCGGDFMYS